VREYQTLASYMAGDASRHPPRESSAACQSRKGGAKNLGAERVACIPRTWPAPRFPGSGVSWHISLGMRVLHATLSNVGSPHKPDPLPAPLKQAGLTLPSYCIPERRFRGARCRIRCKRSKEEVKIAGSTDQGSIYTSP